MDDQLESGDKTTKTDEEFEAPLTGSEVEETENPEFELTPEIEAKIMEKVVAIGSQRDLLSHGTLAPFLDMTAEYGLIAHNPKFRGRWNGYGEYRERRKNLRPGESMMRTEANIQGYQSVSFFDPWNTIEVLEAIKNEQNYDVNAIPIRKHDLHNIPEGSAGRDIKPTSELFDELTERIIQSLPCEIEEINSLYVPPKFEDVDPITIVKGKFKVSNNTLRFLKNEIDEPKRNLLINDIKAVVDSFQNNVEQVEIINNDLKSSTERDVYNKGKFSTLHSTMSDLIEYDHESFIRLYAKMTADKNIHEITLTLFRQLKEVYEGYLSANDDSETKLSSLVDDDLIIRNITSKVWSTYGSILVQLNDNDIKTGRVVRNEGGVLEYPIPSETFIESRIPPRKMVGVVSAMSDTEFSERQNKIARTLNWPQGTNRRDQEEMLNEYISTEKAVNFARTLEIPVYDKEGGLLWPQQMTYEEVKQFVAERDAKKKEISGLESAPEPEIQPNELP